MPTAFQLYLQTVREREAQPYSRGGGGGERVTAATAAAVTATAAAALMCSMCLQKRHDAVVFT